MRALLLALALLTATPTSAVEIIINYTTLPGLVGLATSLGYYANGSITQAGRIASGGSYFFNNVGIAYQSPGVQAPGLWARLRHNGDPAILAAQMPSAATLTSYGVTIYSFYPALNSGSGCWSSDGSTCAPAWVGTIGQIM